MGRVCWSTDKAVAAEDEETFAKTLHWQIVSVNLCPSVYSAVYLKGAAVHHATSCQLFYLGSVLLSGSGRAASLPVELTD